MTFAEPALNLILGDTINALKKAERNSGDPNLGNAPAIFRETAVRIPSLLTYFEKFKQHLDTTMMVEEFPRSAIRTMEICEENATRVNEIFSGVVGSSNAAAQYRKVARGDQLEDLMKKILTDAIEMSNITQLAVIRGAEVEELNKALRSFMAMPASLPENQSAYSFDNSGSGYQNINTSTGNQYNNTGPGNMFTGTIRGLKMSK
ncbi:hypothetical protein LT330_008716 [Penicillium expansum]|uniref:NACHT-NTPase and P-loop NTPases N-terminal domain-containing protein n=1 Tax=Penicillium expansum TaxID=27334 RepID=A0A0A2J168_PENEN|nr:hypothetical protein PEX2_022380 [Penicillium expansum]KAJ5519339.1 hypothetical protein N7453_001761 [Penicillium expansum]KAK4865976.1 hypothetical protein LT330_008716 [Penicillium expansum]KGO49097.1 hypothetical protein PEXP_011460 [Penicillium expansum]KGO57795.1 hypothetical protein PEX2_022380 [Penicillium expansum]KGO72372.1 hypothetical protein PEX1_059720 [Penicillium expansum]